MAKKIINKIFLFPLSLAVIFFASIIIIFSPVGKKNIINVTQEPIEWKTYQNKDYKFTIDYPSDWNIEEINDIDTFTIPLKLISFTSANKNIQLSFGIRKSSENIRTSGRTGVGGGEFIDTKTITFNGQQIKRLVQKESDLCSEAIYKINGNMPGEFSLGKYSYIIEAYNLNNYNLCSAPELETIDQMLSSFKFTN